MTKKIIIGLLCLCIIGCSKENKSGYSLMKIHPNVKPFLDEDELRPILMQKTVKLDSSPLPGSYVVLINGSDTLTDQTNANGEVVIHLPRTGVWELAVTHPGYTPLYIPVNVTDSFTMRTDILAEE